MKKKSIILALLIIGIVFMCVSVLLAVIETVNADIIGGADFPTLVMMFRTHGVYTVLMLCGIVSAIAAAVLLVVKKGK